MAVMLLLRRVLLHVPAMDASVRSSTAIRLVDVSQGRSS